MSDRKQVLLRIDPAVHDALAQWAADEFRSLNAHIEMLLRRPSTTPGECRRGRDPCQAGVRPQSDSTRLSCWRHVTTAAFRNGVSNVSGSECMTVTRALRLRG